MPPRGTHGFPTATSVSSPTGRKNEAHIVSQSEPVRPGRSPRSPKRSRRPGMSSTRASFTAASALSGDAWTGIECRSR